MIGQSRAVGIERSGAHDIVAREPDHADSRVSFGQGVGQQGLVKDVAFVWLGDHKDGDRPLWLEVCEIGLVGKGKAFGQGC